MSAMIHKGWQEIGLLVAWDGETQCCAVKKNLETRFLDNCAWEDFPE